MAARQLAPQRPQPAALQQVGEGCGGLAVGAIGRARLDRVAEQGRGLAAGGGQVARNRWVVSGFANWCR